jgi:uncharacterized protein (PEP-CTERM system associated)
MTFFTLSSGLFYRKPEESGGRTGFVVRGDVARQFSRGNIRFTAGSGYKDTVFTNENLGFTQFYEATLAARYNFTRRLALDSMAGFTHNDYQDQAGRVDDVLTVQAGLSYLIRPWLTSSVRFTRKDSQSTTPGDSYADDRITFGLTFVPTRPWAW